MSDSYTFQFNNDISSIELNNNLNNPFGTIIPSIAKIAATEFQDYIQEASQGWDYNFQTQKGKMFGVLVIELKNKDLAYLGTVSGTLQGNAPNHKLVPAVFNESEADAILSKGLSKLADISQEIKNTQKEEDITFLKEKRKQHSIALQKILFTKTEIINKNRQCKNVLAIFDECANSYPPAAAGECAAPKLLHYAFMHNLKPIAIVEFWWGKPSKSNKREHKQYYPACKEKCRPIIEFMLSDNTLFSAANEV